MNEQNALELVNLERKAVARPLDMEAMFAAAIKLGKEGVEVIKELRALQNAEDAKWAKVACDEAVREFQKLCPKIGKTKGVPDKSGTTAYKYAPFEEIISVIAPILDKCGLSFSFDTDVQSQANWVIAICEITHVRGHSFKKQVKFPLGTKTAIMSDTQQYSAALSFANRRALSNALGLVTVGEDKDGQEAWRARQHGPSSRPEPAKSAANPSVEQPDEAKILRDKLWTLLKPVRGDGGSWMEAVKWLRAQNILEAGKTVASLTVPELKIVLEKADITLNPPA